MRNESSPRAKVARAREYLCDNDDDSNWCDTVSRMRKNNIITLAMTIQIRRAPGVLWRWRVHTYIYRNMCKRQAPAHAICAINALYAAYIYINALGCCDIRYRTVRRLRRDGSGCAMGCVMCMCVCIYMLCTSKGNRHTQYSRGSNTRAADFGYIRIARAD